MGDEGVVPRYDVSLPDSPTGDLSNGTARKGNPKSTVGGRWYGGSEFGDSEASDSE